MTTILFELGTEELPPKNLKTLRDALQTNVEKALKEANIRFDSIKSYAAPRRLALQMFGVAEKAEDRKEIKKGLPIKDKTALPPNFDKFFGKVYPKSVETGLNDFADSIANNGFDTALAEYNQALASDNAKLKLIVENIKNVDYLSVESQITGKTIDEILPSLLQKALDDLPIAKRMRSGASRDEFVRPVKWLVLLKDDEVIPATVQGLTSGEAGLQGFIKGRYSLGHRFHHPDMVKIDHAEDYETALEKAYVIADFDKRQNLIKEQVQQLADEVGATAIVPQDLLDEVTALVDYPVALRASFEQRFLQVPQEALISTMQADQKYFCLTDSDGKLQPYFIFISNIDSKDKAQVIAGNEKVVRPRLADAEFFFLQDQKQPLFALTENLKNRVFQDKLGTIWEKSERIAKLSAFIATLTGADVEDTTRAGILAKADLASTLVGEFPELQGVAGTYYARLNGEKTAVADAIEEQYLPKFSGDKLPQTPIGTALALADRIDTLVGIFGIDQAPTGSKDPFSLRRSAIGVLRILIEKQLPISLVALIEQSLHTYQGKIENLAKTFTDVMNFISSRYRAMYEEQGMSVDSILAVQALNPHMPLDFDQRIRAVQKFRELPQAGQLAEANKRVANILAKAEGNIAKEVNADLLVEEAEKNLFRAVNRAKEVITPLQEIADYTHILQDLANLAEPLQNFFDNVMVNADDVNLKNNRLALLQQVRNLFLSVADISELQL